MDSAVSKVRISFASGKTRDIKYRLEQLKSFRKGLREMKSDFDKARTLDLGMSTFMNFTYEYALVERECDHGIQHINQWVKPVSVDTAVACGPGQSYVLPEPLGVISILGSWNYPVMTSMGPLPGVIAAGNVAILKPSEMSPWCSAWIQKFFEKYLDPDCFVCVPG